MSDADARANGADEAEDPLPRWMELQRRVQHVAIVVEQAQACVDALREEVDRLRPP